MLDHLYRFTRTTPGLEKTLRLVQSLCVLALQIPTLENESISRFNVAKTQFALTRRFLRFFNFIDCFNRAFALLGNPSSAQNNVIKTVIEISKWSCFGCYFLLEDLTLLHATSIYPNPYNKAILTEANKFWFYALGFSILGAAFDILFSSASSASKTKDEKDNKKQAPSINRFSLLKKMLCVDACDLLIPGTFLGLIEMGQLGVGVGMVVSTFVSGWDMWNAV
ncbi:PEX11 domain protein [Aspergillus tubingensis]|uniref:PEX11 domain protein n=1 Tax=Aspergillus tubingensis TaxID=5068 RepID=UPI001577AA46|nr:PEX11 domain protein [Aspergillus tubingensis]GFN17018.1 PEX11 domain protein [Aspergillus tubingensis]